MKNRRPLFSVGEFSEAEVLLIKEQEPVLKKLDRLSYGIYVEEMESNRILSDWREI